jgi:lipoprotein-anchoring transpeptidase ErfK/SrfK
MPRKYALPLAAIAVALVAAATASALDASHLRARPQAFVPFKDAHRLHPLAAERPPAGVTVEQVKTGGKVNLHSSPNGRVIARVGSRTDFGSPQTLTVAARRGSWLGVINEDVSNGGLAWVKAQGRALKPRRTDVVLRVNLADKRLELVDGNHVERKMAVGVGRPGSPTPKGRFSVTDKLSGRAYGGTYGCCILALSGRQPNVPPGWQGGDRLAIHGTDSPGTIGTPASAGCLRASDRDLRVLMRRVPLGTPVFIRA